MKWRRFTLVELCQANISKFKHWAWAVGPYIMCACVLVHSDRVKGVVRGDD